MKADEGTNGDSRLRDFGSSFFANVLSNPEICMRETSFAISQRKNIWILFKLSILFYYTNIIISLNFQIQIPTKNGRISRSFFCQHAPIFIAQTLKSTLLLLQGQVAISRLFRVAIPPLAA
jgi:hypothetical protein